MVRMTCLLTRVFPSRDLSITVNTRVFVHVIFSSITVTAETKVELAQPQTVNVCYVMTCHLCYCVLQGTLDLFVNMFIWICLDVFQFCYGCDIPTKHLCPDILMHLAPGYDSLTSHMIMIYPRFTCLLINFVQDFCHTTSIPILTGKI